MFTVYITSLIQRSHSATIVSIIMLVYLLYFCVSVYMFMYVFCTRHHSLLIVSCVCILGRRPLLTKSINQSIKRLKFNEYCLLIYNNSYSKIFLNQTFWELNDSLNLTENKELFQKYVMLSLFKFGYVNHAQVHSWNQPVRSKLM